jgi:serine protease
MRSHEGTTPRATSSSRLQSFRAARPRTAAVVLAALTIVSVVACRNRDEPPSAEESRSSALTIESRRVTISVPAGVDLRQVAVGAKGNLQVGNGAHILTSTGGFAPSTNADLGASTTSVYGIESRVGPITSTTAVSLQDRMQVSGSVVSGRTVTRGADVTVSGAITQNAVLTPVQEVSWTVDFPLATADVTANSGQTRALTPGAYRNVTAFSNGTVSLSAGTYYLNQLDIEPQGRLVLNAAAGPIVIYVRATLIVRGSMTGATADKVLLAYLGPATLPPAIDNSFGGTLVSSSAPVRLGVGSTTHSGAVFATGVQLDPNVRFTFRSFVGWDAIAFNVMPTLTCIERRSNGTYAAVLGYDNLRSQPVTVAVGAQNGFSPAPQSHGQPTTFLPGRHPSTFSIDFGSAQTLTWQLSGYSLALARTGPACTQPAPIALAQDTTAVKASPRESFGASTTLTVAPGKHTLVAFDRAAIKRLLGPGRYVSRATLELTAATAGATPAVEAKVVYKPWTEAGATWSCADDTNASPTGETCAPGRVWDLEPEELPGVNPWGARGQNRVVGTWAAGKVTFDVTRDTWNLLGAEGVRRGMSWAVVLQQGATGAADLRSRESAQPPRLLLEVSTRPEVDPAGSAPLDFVVDTSLVSQSPPPPPGPDGTLRPMAVLRDPAGRRVDFVANELFVRVRTAAELSALVSRWNGTVVNQSTPPAGSGDPSILAEVRIDSARANAAALLARALEVDNRPRGVHAFSSTTARATMAAGLEEAARGTRVGLNWVAQPDLATTQNWIDRVINDGPAAPGVAAPQPGRNAFLWPAYATCTQDLADPPCVEKLPDGSPIVQALRVADGWRALALSGRMIAGGVLSAIIDAGFDAANPDYPATVLVAPFGQRAAGRHGHFMVLAGYGLVGNDYGGVGPGGPVATVLMVGYSATAFGSMHAFLVARAAGARVASMSWKAEIPAAGNIINLGYDSEELADQMPFFASAGNDNEYIDEEQCFLACWESTSYEPCENEGVNCVEGLAYNSNNRDPSSNSGPSVSFAAPWWPIIAAGTTATPPDFMIFNGGTSSATAFMGGIASMLVAANPSASKSEVLRCLREGSLITAGNGFGRVPNVLRSIRCMMTGSVFGDIPATVVIEVPTTGATIAQGQLTQIRAVATDYETANPVISWSSNIDGPLAQTTSGQNGFAVFATPGTHTVTAAAAGASTTVTVTVAPVAPSVLIVTPPFDGQTFSAGAAVPLAAQASGLPTPPCTAYKWSSVAAGGSVDFTDVSGCSIQVTFSVLGAHTVTVTVTDPTSGLSSSASRTLNIEAATFPVLSIVSPAPLPSGETVILQDEVATLTATASFPVDNYYWSILVNGSEFAVGSGPGSATWRPDTLFNHTCRSIPATLRVNVVGPPALVASIPVYLRPSTAINQELGCIH